MASRFAILTSLLLSSSLGTVFIASYWLHEGLIHRAVTNSVLFIAVMSILHLGGYLTWQNQSANLPATSRNLASPAQVRLNARAFFGLVVFGVFLFLSGMAFNQYLEVKREAARLAADGIPFAPTRISEPAGVAVALLCFGLIGLLAGLKQPAPKNAEDDRAA